MNALVGKDLFGAPVGNFGLIYADPPWRFRNFSAKGEAKNPVAHYECADVSALAGMPVGNLAAVDSVLAMWATFPMLPEALELLRAWGFTYKTGGAWAKRSSTGAKWAFGTGYVFRSSAELLLIGTRGKPAVNNRSTRNLWAEPVREHSRKPDKVASDLEALFDGPYLELFARESRSGWHSWGDEADKFDSEEIK